MEPLISKYRPVEDKIIRCLEASGLRHRTKNCAGLWLGPLVGLSALFTFLNEDASYSELCLIIGITGGGLVISCIFLYIRLMLDNTSAKSSHIIYFIPSLFLTSLFSYYGRKALFVSLLWGLGSGTLSTWGVIQMMSKFPGCFTLGEVTFVTHSIVLFLISACANLPLRYHLPPIHDADIATVILQVLILTVIFIGILCAFFPKLQETRRFYSFLGVLSIVIYGVLYILLDQHPTSWILAFLFQTYGRIVILFYWLTLLVLAGIFIYYFVSTKTQANTAGRKVFHILAVMVYIPGLLWQQTLLYFASGLVLVLFIILEIFRKLQIPPLGNFLQEGFINFADEQDSLISLTPLYLLSGLSAPLWFPTEMMCMLPLMSGILTVGIGDTVASIIGSRWGKHKWVESDKTIEGTIASIVSQFIFLTAFGVFGLIEKSLLVRGICSVILTSLVEAQTEQIDNLALPFLMYLCLIF